MEERPIDTGYAWVICLGVGINSLFLSGPLRSYGILFVEITRRFEAPGTLSAVVLAMISAGMAVTSPIAASLGERYGQRMVIFAGGLLNFIGALLTAFAPNVLYVCIIFGTFTGLGLGCMFAPAMVIIGYYFDKRRSTANGLSLAGGSIGQMTIPVLFTYLLEEYSFQGGLLIFAALLLHICVGASLLRPVTYYKPLPTKKSEKQPKKDVDELVVEVINDDDRELVPQDIPAVMVDGELVEDPHLHLKERKLSATHTQSLHNLNKPKEFHRLQKGELGKSLPLLDDNDLQVEATEKDISRAGSLYLLPHQPITTHTPQEKGERTELSQPFQPVPKKKSMIKSCCMFMYKLYDWTLFKDPVWLLYAAAVSTGQSGYMTVCLFLPAFATEKGVSKYLVSSLLSIAGAFTLVGRIGGGAFADLGLLKRYTLSCICTAILSVGAFLLPFVPYYWAMCVYAAMLGLIGGVFVAQIVSVVIELMGIEKMSPSLGLSFMVSGLSQIPIPIMLGMLKDYTGTYNWSMFMCALMLALGSITLMAGGRLADKKRAQHKT